MLKLKLIADLTIERMNEALATKTIQHVLTPLDRVDMLCEDNLLDRQTLAAIDRVGHSRLPVFRGQKHVVDGCN